jgi:hypothetical protein
MDLRNHSPETSAVRSQTAESASAKETASIVRIDPQASAALASAINSAKQGVNLEGAAGSTEPQETTPDAMPLAGARKGYSNAYLSRAAMGLVLIGSCWVASYAGTLASRDSIQQFGTDAARSEVALGRINGEIEALKTELAAFREAVNAASAAERRQSAKLGEKIDGFGQALRNADATRNSDAKFAALDARLGKMEGQILTTLASMTAKPAAPATDPASTASVAPTPVAAPVPPPAPAPAVKPAKNDPAKNEPVDGWVVREVYDGAALVEGRNRRLYEVVPGGVVPGVGRVESIERRGRSWVVLTDKGVIGTYR